METLTSDESSVLCALELKMRVNIYGEMFL